MPKATIHLQMEHIMRKESKWQNVIVPSSLVMQGFDIENNT